MAQPTRTTAALTATAVIAVLATLMIAGCHSTSTAADDPTAAGDPTAARTAGGCTPWPGLPYDSIGQLCPDSQADT